MAEHNMTVTVDVDELARRLPELLAEVEAGNEVIIARGTKPVARIEKVSRPSPGEVEAAIAAIRAARKDFAPTTIDEILAWRDEGRR